MNSELLKWPHDRMPAPLRWLLGVLIFVALLCAMKVLILLRASQLESAQYGRWLAGDPPSFLKAKDDSALSDKAAELARKLQEGHAGATLPIVIDAEIILDPSDPGFIPTPPVRGESSWEASSLVGTVSKVSVHPSPDSKERNESLERRFSAEMKELLRDNGGEGYAKRLAASLGLDSTSPIRVPWIYIARKDGYQITFPGTNETDAEQGYNPKIRPWYIAHFGTAKRFGATTINSLVLTHAYPDITVGTYIRTLLIPLAVATPDSTPKELDYVLCIDLLWIPPEVGSVAPGVAPELASLDRKLVLETIDPWSRPGLTLGLAFVSGLLMYLLFYSKRSSSLVLEATLHQEGISELKRRYVWTNQFSRTRRISFGVPRRLVTLEESEKEEKAEMDEVTVRTRLETHRGCEYWRLTVHEERNYYFLGRQTSRQLLAEAGITVKYTGRALPEIDIPIGLKQQLDIDVPIVRDCIFSRDHRLRLGESPSQAPEVPEAVEALMPSDRHEKPLYSPRFGRVYFDDRLGFLSRLYSDKRVRAVIHDLYLMRVLESDGWKFFKEGEPTHRIVASTNARDHWKHLPDDDKALLKERLKSLRASNLDIQIAFVSEAEIRDFPEIDFALLDESLVVVTEKVVSEVSTEGQSTTMVRGYVSWRQADVLFYEELYARLDEKPESLAALIDEPTDPGQTAN